MNNEINSVLDFRQRKPPFNRNYLNNFMLYNMLGHVWLDGKECPWPTVTTIDSNNELRTEYV